MHNIWRLFLLIHLVYSIKLVEIENSPTLHKCVDLGEAYSASYLTSKQHLLLTNTQRNYSRVSCEMASSIMLATAKRRNNKALREKLNKFLTDPDSKGIAIMTLNVLDFSVIHLSAYERSNRKYKNKILKIDSSFNERDINPVIQAGTYLSRLKRFNIDSRAYQTVAVMPFLGVNMGAGHSELSNRYEYLKVCFWSLYLHFPNIVVGVLSLDDVNFIKNTSMPFFDIIYLDSLPKSSALPVGVLNEAKKRLKLNSSSTLHRDRTWDFNYFFFTESDQILLMRNSHILYDHVDRYPRRMLLPHRLMAYPEIVLSHVHKRKLISAKKSQVNLFDSSDSSHGSSQNSIDESWRESNCCLTKQNCVDRSDWVHVQEESVPVLNIFGLQVPLGNSHFLIEKYRPCRIIPPVVHEFSTRSNFSINQNFVCP